ncbi:MULTISPECIES: helix-turn-helix domain-containing protein [unclassified Saccharicrinis]|uniref:helix-turn-helix domain-containing protein n=1 Tax=unclassified Saccharicrinis TaxID=2646859 RepID=UPI003D3382C6
MINNEIKISKIVQHEISKPKNNYYSIIWITGTIDGLLIDGVFYEYISNTLFFLNPKYQWKILTGDDISSKGYVMYLSDNVLNEPFLNKLKINEARILHSDTIHKTQLAPGIEIRVQAVLEMLDELLTTNLNHKEDAILALINTFFIYCDGQCNIKSTIDNHNSKATLVYKFKRLLSKHVTEIQKVNEYAKILNISSTYLNECIREVLGVNAKSLIIEQLVMRTRHALKFTDKPSKEIAYELGFSSPDYFSSFCKNHIGYSPSEYRKV